MELLSNANTYKIIKLINFLLKIVCSFLVIIIAWINFIIVIIMWDGNYMKAFEILDLIWKKNKHENKNK